MDVKQYRDRVASEIGDEKRESVPGTAESVPSGRVGDTLSAAISILADTTQPPSDRLEAFRLVQSATFSGSAFNAYRLPYREALRAAAIDENLKLREKALEALALQKDDFAREKLLQGLDDESQALVSTAKAIQFLGQDDHDVATAAARRILEADHDVGAKNEALRVLAKDPNAAGILKSVMEDKKQPELLRTTSATSLRLIDPAQFVESAQRIVADETEADDVRASSLGALSHLQGRGTLGGKDFKDMVSNLESSASTGLKAAAQRFTKSGS